MPLLTQLRPAAAAYRSGDASQSKRNRTMASTEHGEHGSRSLLQPLANLGRATVAPHGNTDGQARGSRSLG